MINDQRKAKKINETKIAEASLVCEEETIEMLTRVGYVDLIRNAELKLAMDEIKSFDTFNKIEPVNKGWSPDKKFRIETTDGQHLLLRIADISEYDRKKAEFEMLKRAEVLGVPISAPIAFGLCNGGRNVYSLLTWCEGKDMDEALPMLTETEQYLIGMKAGRLLAKIHSLPAPENAEPWDERFRRKINGRLEQIIGCDTDISMFTDYLSTNQGLLDDRPQCFNHGDFNTSNLILTPDNEVGVIDFNYFNSDHGDPWWEFCTIPYGKEANPHFYSGLIKGYFNGQPPHNFFDVLMYYFAYDAVAALCETAHMSQSDKEDAVRHGENILLWFNNFQTTVPRWYLDDFYVQYTNGVPYKLKAPFDFSFLSKYGNVFKVWDDQDSGNICFGVTAHDRRCFVKFAGAPTGRACITPEEAILNLKHTVPVYNDLAHPNLIKLVDAGEIGDGFAMVFEWINGECMGRMYPQSRQRFMQMSLQTKLKVYEDILDFHRFVASKGYVAIDFYDGSIMYDFSEEKTAICDIDLYTRMPYTNTMGRLWGSSRFMSPEEFKLGATIDEVTNVYTMGAVAFALFSDYERAQEKWPLSTKLFRVVSKAVNNDRSLRQQSMEQLISEWTKACSN